MRKRLIYLLFEGKTQIEISKILKTEGVKPNSLSVIEKELKQLRKENGANTMFHLAVKLSKNHLR